MSNKTKEMIIDNFLSLLETVEFDKLSVTDLVEKCDISRQTFYYHFNDIIEMLQWAFDKETDEICERAAQHSNWVKSATEYIPFFEKYHPLFKSIQNSKSFVKIYNMIAKSVYYYTYTYFERNNAQAIKNKNTEFMLKCTAYSFVGLVVEEIQKEKPDYDTMFEYITKTFNIQNKE